MNRTKKTRRRIQVRGVEYRWVASGNDGYIAVTVKPANQVGPIIETNFSYDESWQPNGVGFTSTGDQIVITNRIVKRVIEYAIDDLKFNPEIKGRPLRILEIEKVIDLSDAIRATDT